MIKASGKSRAIIIVISAALIAAGIWMIFSRQQQTLPFITAKVRANRDHQKNLKTLRLNGRVRSLREVNYRLQVSVNELADSVAHQDMEIDERGNVTRHVIFDQMNQLMADQVYTYDDAGNYISRTIHNPEGRITSKETFSFTDEGKFADVTLESKDSQYHWIYEYTDTTDGYIQEVIQMLPPLPLPYSFKRVFDTLKNEVRVEHLFPDWKKQWLYIRLDKRGNMIERTLFDPVNIPIARYASAYNTNDLPVREEYSINKNTEHYYAYDTHGNVIEYTQITCGDVDQKSYRAVYTYDSNGNWTHRDILRLDGTPKTSVDRVIEYY